MPCTPGSPCRGRMSPRQCSGRASCSSPGTPCARTPCPRSSCGTRTAPAGSAHASSTRSAPVPRTPTPAPSGRSGARSRSRPSRQRTGNPPGCRTRRARCRCRRGRRTGNPPSPPPWPSPPAMEVRRNPRHRRQSSAGSSCFAAGHSTLCRCLSPWQNTNDLGGLFPSPGGRLRAVSGPVPQSEDLLTRAAPTSGSPPPRPRPRSQAVAQLACRRQFAFERA
jgi:hypothetical protein